MNRIQTGVRIDASVLKVLKGLAEYKNITLGDLLEGICLHAFEGSHPFEPATIEVINKLRDVYGCKWSSLDSHLHPEVSGRGSQ